MHCGMTPPQNDCAWLHQEICRHCEVVRSVMMLPSSNPYLLARGSCFALAAPLFGVPIAVAALFIFCSGVLAS